MIGQIKVPVIVPYFKAPDLIAKCQRHMINSIGVAPEFMIRDNSEDNILYTRAINEKLRLCRDREFALILTQDCFVSPDCLWHLVEHMRRNPRCGIAAPVQLGDSYGSGVTWGGSLEAWPAGRHIVNKLEELQRVGPQLTYWANGACFLVRMNMVNEIGLMVQDVMQTIVKLAVPLRTVPQFGTNYRQCK